MSDPAPAESPACILVASGDPQVIAAAEPVLRASGYNVEIVTSGPDVLHFTDEHALDLYLIDADLPVMDGLRVARHLRQSYGIPRERIILLVDANSPTSYPADLQANDILICPFTGVELILTVMRHLA
jgi:two-component system, OmpR family, copper resistance phosphate regulon response regulator CusR